MSISRELSGDGRTARRAGRSAGRFGGGSLRRGVVVLVAAAVVVSACGSSSEESAPSPKPAGAQENAVTSAAVCYSWPNGTTDAQPCAVGLKGPGGGRVFYDAGSVQPWGRFLEVAPSNWGPTLVACYSCGAATGVTKATSDGGSKGDSGGGFYPCRNTSSEVKWTGAIGASNPTAIGDGRRNTELLLQTPDCVDGTQSAVTLAAGYRGLGLADWYLPSQDELVELCKYEGRNAIGGFTAGKYVSSTSFETSVGSYGITDFKSVDFESKGCTPKSSVSNHDFLVRFVRPIRAFS
ncbi:MAG: hypothetical protein RL219_1102 [Actinomycetota bacterium]